ncbi:Lipase, class 3 [Cordyceps fumosorosea ARSEF 2679]|uniref:sn-1-specific diacylglycerol lipase n=1 Tax=Cordyceps fumosorosea (strain ARSEF 2679) TaxID=1081104 RepID=A0A167LN90_CORFA|nr:Lipase, class 3 [Cordyceps fumosorosea ARSEF 2679]OAA53291.1 Lipase, class 3 [Cordyceps fumosorosea ARSEF 2679]
MARDEPLTHKPGPTLLPGPIASTVSLAARSTSLAIRLGSLVGGYGLDAARFTTLSSLELARGLVEVVLTRAGKDTLDHAKSSLAASDAENVLERSLEGLHYAVIQVAFWTSASFRLTGTTLSLASDTSQLFLSSLDKLLGSTDSSRAVASIITLIRREFRNPVTGTRGERVGVLDLTLALSALAYLQQACRKLPDEEARRNTLEEVIWDVVVLNDGDRVDIDDRLALQRGYAPARSPEISRRGSQDEEETLALLKSHITQSLPPETKVTISNSVTAVQTITVEVEGCLPILPTPPGAEIIETTTPVSKRLSYPGHENDGPYRVVYRIERDKFRAMTLQGGDDAETGSILGEIDSDKESPQPMQYDPATGTFVPVLAPLSPPKDARDLKSESPISSPETQKSEQMPRTSEARMVEPTANQKRQRQPATAVSSGKATSPTAKRPVPKKKADSSSRSTDKRSGLKQVLKDGGQSISNMWNKDTHENGPRSKQVTTASSRIESSQKVTALHSRPTKASQERSIANRRSLVTPEPLPRSSSHASYISLADRRQTISSQGGYPVIKGGAPPSPTLRKQDASFPQEPAVRSRRGSLLSGNVPASPMRGHRRSGSYAPSIYSLATNDSQTSLVLSSYFKKSSYSTADALHTLRREGFVDGTFPEGHLLPNITRYMRFSSACYGSHFLKFLGISNDMPKLTSWDGTHQDVRHFAHHTESNAGNILLASFVDPQGGADSTGATGTGVPLVHYISLDHEAKAVVLACRGTLGFEDVMADMTCDYDNLVWKKRPYKVHKGVHASARRLLYGDDGRVLVTLKEALVEFPDYGLVLCGHSLGGAVTALLGVMLAEANPHGPGFVTAPKAAFKKMLSDGISKEHKYNDTFIPAGRRIHVYAYGSPGVMSAKLRKITRGLITTVVHGDDLVPHLSLGILHDFQALSLAFKDKENATKAEIRRRMWATFQNNLSDAWHSGNESRAVPGNDDDKWMLPALAALRENFKCERLVPPGEVFVIESYPVLRREAFLLNGEGLLGRPATRVILKYVRDVETRFLEPRFGTSMLTDHSPANYENALNKMKLGVVD